MSKPVDSPSFSTALERLFVQCHDPALVDPDPLSVVRRYTTVADRELVGLVCSALAVGRASLIVKACDTALSPLGSHPAAFLDAATPADLARALRGFTYRFFTERDLFGLLSAIGTLRRLDGSLEAVFAESEASALSRRFLERAGPAFPVLVRTETLVSRLESEAAVALRSADARGLLPPSTAGLPLARNLLSAPSGGSACKRMMLFLRWMVRSDSVDPGGWTEVLPSQLVVPLDVHIHRIAGILGLRTRRVPDLGAALEVTSSLRRFDEADPVRFDFSLSRIGIRSDYRLESYFPY